MVLALCSVLRRCAAPAACIAVDGRVAGRPRACVRVSASFDADHVP